MNLAIFMHTRIGPTETFIRAHAEQLPTDLALIHDRPPKVEGSSVSHVNYLRRFLRSVQRRAGVGPTPHQARTEAYVRLLKQSNAEAVLAEYGPGGVAVLPACAQLNLPLIVHFHGFDASQRNIIEKYRAAYIELFKYTAGIIAVSKAMREKLISLGASPDKVYYNPYGVDVNAFSQSSPAENDLVFLSVGRFVEKKAPHLTLLAFAEVYRQCPNARLRMVGDGHLLDACRDLAVALDIANAVTFLGHQSHEVVQDEMQHARAFVQHSLVAPSGDSEGTPVAILEAQASGLPIVSTFHAGIPDVVVEEKTGLLVPERDVQQMAKQMIRFIEEPTLAAQLGRAGRERVLAHFTMEKSIDRLWKIITSCVSERRTYRVEMLPGWARELQATS